MSDWRAYYCDENADSNRRLDAEAARNAEYTADALAFRFADPCQNCRFIVIMPTPAGGWACSLCGLERVSEQPCRCSLPDQSCPRCAEAAARNEAYLKESGIK